jgi:hypothetical protein
MHIATLTKISYANFQGQYGEAGIDGPDGATGKKVLYM